MLMPTQDGGKASTGARLTRLTSRETGELAAKLAGTWRASRALSGCFAGLGDIRQKAARPRPANPLPLHAQNETQRARRSIRVPRGFAGRHPIRFFQVPERPLEAGFPAHESSNPGNFRFPQGDDYSRE